MKSNNVTISFNEYEIAMSFFTFSKDAKKHIEKVLNDSNISYKPFFLLVIKYLLFNDEHCVSLDECRILILRYTVLFVYVAYNKDIGSIKAFDNLINNMSIEALNEEIKAYNNTFVSIYNNRCYKNEFIGKTGVFKTIHSILTNDFDFFSTSNDDIDSYDSNRLSFDLMVCAVAFEQEHNFKVFDLELIDSDEYRNYITNGQKVNYLIIALVLYTLVTNNKLKTNDLFKIESRSYYRIANIGNTSTKIAPAYISFLEIDEQKGYAKIYYSTIKKDLAFKLNGVDYLLTNKGIKTKS